MPYFHVVFTVPHELNLLALANPKWFYDLLFASASRRLEIAADPKHLGVWVQLQRLTPGVEHRQSFWPV